MLITNPLSAPSSAILGNQVETNTERQYTVLGLFDTGIVYRTAGQKLVIAYDDSYEIELPGQCSALFENNTYISDNGFLIYPYKKGTQDWYVYSFDLVNRSLVRDTFLVVDPGFPSVAIDEFLDRIVFYKADPRESGLGYAKSFTWTNNILSDFFSGIYVQNVIIHLAFKNGTTGFFRSIYNFDTNQGKISDITGGTIDGELYNYIPAGGETIIQDINNDDIWYPVVSPDNANIFVLNNAATEISAWSTSVLNTQSLSPSVIDTRDFLYHSQDKIGYPRLFGNIAHNIVYDQRTLTAIDATGLSAADDYPICINGLVTAYPTGALELLDRQTAYLQSNSTKRGCVLNKVYDLDSSQSCSIVFQEIVSAAQANFLLSDRPDLRLRTGLFEDSPSLSGNGQVYYADQNVVIYESSFQAYEINGNAIAGNSNNVFNFVAEGDYYVIINETHVNIYNFITDTLTSAVIPGGLTITNLYDNIIWNNKAYFRGVNQVVIADLDTLTVQSATINFAASGKISQVKLIPNPLDGNLYLYDNTIPTNLYRLTINLAFEDYVSDYLIFSVLVTDQLPVGIRPSSVSVLYAAWIRKETLLFYESGTATVQIIKNLRDITQKELTGLDDNGSTFDDRTYINVFNNYIYLNRLNGILEYNDSTLSFLPLNTIAMETPGGPEYGAITFSPIQGGVFGSQDNKLTFFLNADSPIIGTNDPVQFATFETVGRRMIADPLVAQTSTHSFGVDTNTEFFVRTFDSIPEGGYESQLLMETTNNYGNDHNKINSYKRENNRVGYKVRYYTDEETVTFFSNLFHTQAAWINDPASRLNCYFKDLYRQENVSFDFQPVKEILFTEVYFEWYHKDIYLLTLEFETI